MRQILAAALIALSVFTGAAVAEPARFLSAYEDVPLAPGLQERTGSVASIEGPEGVIVAAEASGAADREAVLRFYQQTLPQLGWTRSGENYRRGRQSLVITARADASGLVVRYRLVERPASLQVD